MSTATLPRSPLTVVEFETMQKSALFGPDDVAALRLSHDVLADQVEAILDVWYGFVGSQEHLLASFSKPRTNATAPLEPIPEYLGGVRKRFGAWILDTAKANYDQTWLDYQHLIALRHHRIAKGTADKVVSSAIVPFRDLFALVVPITTTLRPFLAKKGHSEADVTRMHAAWVKSCILQVTLWSHPYVREGDF